MWSEWPSLYGFFSTENIFSVHPYCNNYQYLIHFSVLWLKIYDSYHLNILSVQFYDITYLYTVVQISSPSISRTLSFSSKTIC